MAKTKANTFVSFSFLSFFLAREKAVWECSQIFSFLHCAKCQIYYYKKIQSHTCALSVYIINTHTKSANKYEGWNWDSIQCAHICIFVFFQLLFLTGFSFHFLSSYSAIYLFCVLVFYATWQRRLCLCLMYKAHNNIMTTCVCVPLPACAERQKERESMICQWWAQHCAHVEILLLMVVNKRDDVGEN